MSRGISKSSARAGVGGAVLVVLSLWVLLLSFCMNVYFGAGTLERISTESMDVHADFDTFWRSAAALWSGSDVYDTGARLENLNPPLWVLLISPLGLLEPLTAYRIFITLTLVVTVGYLAWTCGELRVPAGWAAAATGMLLVSSPFLATLALGQVYAFLALGLVAAWGFDRRGRPLLSGCSLGLAVAIKPSLAPVILWPVMRKRWDMFAATLVCGAAATLLAAAVVGVGATFDWARVLLGSPLSPYWDNASLPSAAARLFRENEFARPVAELPWLVPVAYVAGIALLALSAARVRRDPEMGMWSLVAASLLASPVAWHNYLMLLAPALLLLLRRGKIAAALLLLALQTIPPQWPLIWSGDGTILASMMLTLYLYILLLHWVFLLPGKSPAEGAAGRTAV